MGLLQVKEVLSVGMSTQIQGEALLHLWERAERAGDLVTVRDGRGKDHRGRVVTLTRVRGEVFIFASFPLPVESPLAIHLIQALPKKERFEWIIQKATELGIHSITPFESDHSVSLEERNRPQGKSHRWQAIATRAARQCRRATIPVLQSVHSFEEALRFGEESDLRLLLWARQSNRGIKSVLAGSKDIVRSLSLVVGPEGGFSERELVISEEVGYLAVGLGQRILRTETAAIAAVTIVQYELGDLGGWGKKQKSGQRRKVKG
jgi:16S rRNA (uracil1498-N3)-methyltransferase